MTERYVYIIAAVLCGISLATFYYKWQVLGFPLTANRQQAVWTVETSIRFDDGHEEQCDWEKVVKMFADAGYKGYMALEYEAKEDPFTAVPRHLKRINELTRRYSS